MFYFRDLRGLPVQEYWHDMKFWWPHNEAIIATLLAFQLTGDAKYVRWHQLVHDWSFQHFADPECGEWYGYLHRDGRISSRAKGTMYKGPFHLPRMLWYCAQLSAGAEPVAAGPGAWPFRSLTRANWRLALACPAIILLSSQNRSRTEHPREKCRAAWRLTDCA